MEQNKVMLCEGNKEINIGRNKGLCPIKRDLLRRSIYLYLDNSCEGEKFSKRPLYFGTFPLSFVPSACSHLSKCINHVGQGTNNKRPLFLTEINKWKNFSKRALYFEPFGYFLLPTTERVEVISFNLPGDVPRLNPPSFLTELQGGKNKDGTKNNQRNF